MRSTHIHSIGPLKLHNGHVLQQCEVAYNSYGTLANDGRNAIVVTHGYTASHQLLTQGSAVAEGPWAALMGPGKPLDTDRFFIICPNMLGSCYGSTGPSSINPATQQVYGPDFPDINMSDIVATQYALVKQLGIQHLRAVVGPSLGGFQALQWIVDYPDFVDVAGAIVSASYLPACTAMSLPHLLHTLQACPDWPAAQSPSMQETLYQLRLQTLQTYGMPHVLESQGLPAKDIRPALQSMAKQWAKHFNPHSLVTLLKAALSFDVRAQLPTTQANVLHVVADSDALFPPDKTIHAMQSMNGRLKQLVLNTPMGHSCSGPLHAVWGPLLQKLLQEN
ncbi:alpha/beta fold hydrolase [Lampropedia puyangensis]|uniref:Alpha/beta fold hydrolase n=1 Tax=Lampropedia puyangensis TaxID=1330072 RepID=A0A4S8F872_9BURK|nr:alpha/beta fold hydrolase [Lampropedia puyangensis]THU03793.1 alpha/beta fold hydrolase [Lampropedia puyangensis]